MTFSEALCSVADTSRWFIIAVSALFATAVIAGDEWRSERLPVVEISSAWTSQWNKDLDSTDKLHIVTLRTSTSPPPHPPPEVCKVTLRTCTPLPPIQLFSSEQ